MWTVIRSDSGYLYFVRESISVQTLLSHAQTFHLQLPIDLCISTHLLPNTIDIIVHSKLLNLIPIFLFYFNNGDVIVHLEINIFILF